jgi:hypothetical protein
MDCRQCNDEMTAFMDGELGREDAQQIAQHMSACRSCAAEWAELRASAQIIATHARTLDPAPEMWNKLHARIVQMPAPGNSSGIFRFLVVNRWATALATLAATALLALGLWSYLQYRHSQNELEIALQEYVQSRNVVEHMSRLQLRQAMRIPALRGTLRSSLLTNPFADTRQVSYTNPFMAEER